MSQRSVQSLVIGLLLTCSLGCRSVLPGDQPSRIWEVYSAQQRGATHVTTRPKSMQQPQALGTVQATDRAGETYMGL